MMIGLVTPEIYWLCGLTAISLIIIDIFILKYLMDIKKLLKGDRK